MESKEKLPKLRNRLLELLREKSRKEKRRITQSELSEETGIANNTISYWVAPEPKMTKLDIRVIVSLCVYFNCEVGDLLYLEHEMEDE